MNAFRRFIGLLLLGLLLVHPQAQAQSRAPRAETHWVASWAAAPQDFALAPAWAVPKQPAPSSLADQTLRQQLQPTLGGQRLRIRFSNLFGKTPLHIASATVAVGTGAASVSPSTLRNLRFGGRAGITIAPGAEAWSDPVRLDVDPARSLMVSFHIDAPMPFATVHMLTPGATWIAAGDQVRRPAWPDATRSMWNHIVTGLDVARSSPARVVVAFGDSITEGAGIEEAAARYPERLAVRLRGQPRTAGFYSVLNTGISGNRLLTDGIGPRAIDRFRRDALGQSGVTHVIILIGINDIGMSMPAGESPPVLGPPSAEQLAAGLQQLIAEARGKGVKVLLGTLLPFQGAIYWSAEKELRRQTLNRWIRGRFDVNTVVDFDAALRDPANPLALNPVYDSGDHLHPGKVGHAAMADVIDLRGLQD
ncbi:SGNH/GDSL hydrolase family protein [Variovorax sp. Sphag1AA]|uniref:SGNH/GDSL hydrolase family protein n=1 Tax=Variovorax sp. Sphag1AA TaxID=2587027 RepID=UPI001611105A|nr:SGNH/GDSL hydrolase family protein [Variovorax sp. Sphag1AA]MBB3180046.1 lysophospholipase L1-like esterase [Variovorax sp. Sphag1AA]